MKVNLIGSQTVIVSIDLSHLDGRIGLTDQ